MINITRKELNSVDRDFQTDLANIGNKIINGNEIDRVSRKPISITNYKDGIIINKQIGKKLFENYFKDKNKNNKWKANNEEINMIKIFLDKFGDFKITFVLIRCGKIKIKLRYRNFFKIWKTKTTNDAINEGYYNFFRNECIFKVILFDICNQFSEYFPDLEFKFKSEAQSSIELQYLDNNSEGNHYDGLLSIKSIERYIELGYEFDERSHDYRREKDKRRNTIANNTLYYFKICKEVFNGTNEYYLNYFKDIINNLFETCCVLTKNKKLLCIKLVVDEYINDENCEEHIEGIENYFDLKNNNNLYKLAYIFNTEPEELYNNLIDNNIKFKFKKECDCDLTEICDCYNCDLKNNICNNNNVCICKWQIDGSISTLINKLPNDSYLTVDRYKDYIGIASDKLEIASDRIIEVLSEKMDNFLKHQHEFCKYIKNSG
jgi:hypothetical protein